MNIPAKKILLLTAALWMGATFSSTAMAYQTDECGPMCHRSVGSHPGVGGGPQTGTFADMKRRLKISHMEEATWNRFQRSVFDRMSAAFDAELLTQEALTKSPDSFNPENMEPLLSTKMITQWKNVLTTFDQLQATLSTDRKRVDDLIKKLCSEIK
jgi:hypothetical protein